MPNDWLNEWEEKLDALVDLIFDDDPGDQETIVATKDGVFRVTKDGATKIGEVSDLL